MQSWQRPVTRRNHALCGLRPDDGEIGIIPADAARGFRAMGLRDMVDDFGVIGQSLKTVGKSCWDVYRRPIVGGQLDRDPFGACGGSRTSNIAPRVQRTSLISSYGAAWKWRPRTVSRW